MRKRGLPRRSGNADQQPSLLGTQGHFDSLAAEFGHKRGVSANRESGRPVGLGTLLLQPLSLFILSVMALAMVLGVKYWRAGAFDHLFAPRGAVVDVAPKRWMLNHGAARVHDDTVGEPDTPVHEPPSSRPPPSVPVDSAIEDGDTSNP